MLILLLQLGTKCFGSYQESKSLTLKVVSVAWPLRLWVNKWHLSRSLSFSGGLIQHLGSRHVHRCVNFKSNRAIVELTLSVGIGLQHFIYVLWSWCKMILICWVNTSLWLKSQGKLFVPLWSPWKASGLWSGSVLATPQLSTYWQLWHQYLWWKLEVNKSLSGKGIHVIATRQKMLHV